MTPVSIRRGRRTRTRAEQDNSSNETHQRSAQKAAYANRHGMVLLIPPSVLLSLSFSVTAIMHASGIMRMLCGCGMLKL
jgi:hypothetical protein